jgi:alpha-amylase
MLATSDLVDGLPDGPLRDTALDHLYAGQSNDCYWHGLFGGIYLPDLRVAALARLIAAEDLATGLGAPTATLRDVDLDDREEVVLSGPGEFVTVKLEEGGGIGRWDLRAGCHPLAAVMRRRPEAYHETLRQYELAHAAGAGSSHDAGHATDADGSAAPASIHDIVKVKQEGLLDHLRYDAYERRSALVRILPPDTSPTAAAAGTAEELAGLRDGAWTLESVGAGRVGLRRSDAIRMGDESVPIEATKTISIGGGRLDPCLEIEIEIIHRGHPDSPRIDALLAIEWSTMLLGGGHNPAAWHDIGGSRIAHDETTATAEVSRLTAGNDQLGITIETVIDRPVEVWIAPIQTVSNSEGGFELVYQGCATLVVEPLRLAPGERVSLRIGHQVTVAGERFGGGPPGARTTNVSVKVEPGGR